MKNNSISTCPAIALTLALGALLLCGGCATSVNSFQRAQAESTPSYVNDQRIITDSTLARALAVRSINEGYASGNLLQIQATVENLKNGPKSFRYKFDWISGTGMAVGDTGWRQLNLRGRETSAVSAIATNPRAVDFRLKFEEM
ncbi:MAG: YcfL family protein [Opitutaceae bacterium]|jgi:uncharacterized protein YcfL|nr:YcfL family protein [Opitutaceae bacterium]